VPKESTPTADLIHVRRSSYRTALALAAIALLAAVGCGGHGDSGKAAPSTVRIDERDFRIKAPNTAAAGDVRFSVVNRGPVAHELIVARSDGSPLPFRADGLTVSEDDVEDRIVGALEPDPATKTRELRVRLKPGRYKLFCNMSGHYLAGMHQNLTVH
jgi:uncharacterized cupredoxin-like copper-binding protein